MATSYPEMESTRAFWNVNPCGMHGSYEDQKAQRYAMEPWLPGVLKYIASTQPNSILEIGCGQGIDSITLCTILSPGARYIGIDYSEKSIESAAVNATSCSGKLAVRPSYRVGNAESLVFSDDEFEVVCSLGVIHHTHDEFKALFEVHRVLKPGGTAYIALYRKPSLKVAVAQGLRAFQKAIDLLLGTDRCIYALVSRMGTSSKNFGTMFHECFGVPYLKWYNRMEIEKLFSAFSSVSLKVYGPNFGRIARGGDREIAQGYYWFITAVK